MISALKFSACYRIEGKKALLLKQIQDTPPPVSRILSMQQKGKRHRLIEVGQEALDPTLHRRDVLNMLRGALIAFTDDTGVFNNRYLLQQTDDISFVLLTGKALNDYAKVKHQLTLDLFLQSQKQVNVIC